MMVDRRRVPTSAGSLVLFKPFLQWLASFSNIGVITLGVLTIQSTVLRISHKSEKWGKISVYNHAQLTGHAYQVAWSLAPGCVSL